MAQKIGIIYSSVDGQTKKICEKLKTIFEDKKIETNLYSIDTFNDDLLDFNTLIIGASIRYGKHHHKVSKFIEKNISKFHKIQTAFFSVNLVARNEDKNAPNTNPYLIKFLKNSNFKPDILEVFAGKLDYKSYSIIDKLMIKLIMRLTHGPTSSNTPIEYTDWTRVNNFGLRISKTIKLE
ncbi:menaquinone-dependent protoporphyrinogen IX dehydrogenase [Winogradskyella wichelsiae]|uniref:menaquinone-dependent protoporphyrinogen IX dehydrogenase n=1 Tax=Winogradskyella wichelsiae TaxID=2697007 RepID=UPI0015CCDCD8|nr:menaquinone-dependent protoporphyrinogen IX dehydrogenase [Winogradskyella wichelsiae]